MQRIAHLVLVPALVLCTALAARADAPTFEPPVVLSNTSNSDVDSNDFEPVAASDGSGSLVVAWASNDTLLGTIDTDFDILFMRSTDGGFTFTDPAPLNTNAYDDTAYFYDLVVGLNDQKPALAAHGSRFIAVWETEIPTSLSGLSAYAIALARSDDGGVTWSPRAILYEASFTPSIATDGAGTWVIVWRYRPGSPSVDGDIFYTRSTDDGLTWSPPSPLDSGAGADVLQDYDPHVLWSNGVWSVAWWGGQGPFGPVTSHVLLARSIDGQTWSAPSDLHPTSPTVADRRIAIAAGGGGSLVATWSSGEQQVLGTDDILTCRSTDGGLTWTAPAILNSDHATDGRSDSWPSVAALDAGTYAAVWVRNGIAGDPGFDHQDVLTATSADGGATWSAPTPLNPVAAADGERNDLDFNPSVAADGGRFLALWISNDRQLTSNTKTHDLDVVMSFAGEPCGNGALDAGEVCDDGDRGSLDCCGRTCGYDSAGAVCAADADPCSLERCDGAGTCGHDAAPLDTPCALDADLCTYDRCDGNFLCEHVSAPRPVCPGSARAKGSLLKITGGTDPMKRKIAWSMKHGPFRPLTTYVNGATYALCMYDGAGLIARIDAPVDQSCKGHSCWRATNSAIKYSDREGTPNGATSGMLKYGNSAETSLKLGGRGPNLGAPLLPSMSLPVQAQLVSDELNNCFGATYSAAGVKLNSAAGFKATSD